jgi:hypothetical protein
MGFIIFYRTKFQAAWDVVYPATAEAFDLLVAQLRAAGCEVDARDPRVLED